jgi:outer membrane protein OmpA-like peptidoglycan-associated protein
MAGYAGPAGRAGPAGEQGLTGDRGAQGPTLVGPAGPAGRSGPAGEQGIAGQTGAQGSLTAGAAGPAGRAGPAGEQGSVGAIGSQGPVGAVARWTPYREFWFDANKVDLQSSDASKVSEIADYMKQNPSLRIGIDDTNTNPRSDDMSERRVRAVRSAMIQAGVPSAKIQSGAYGDAKLAQDRRVEVLVRSDY